MGVPPLTKERKYTMKIKITDNNKEKLEEALAQANGKCKERLIHAQAEKEWQAFCEEHCSLW